MRNITLTPIVLFSAAALLAGCNAPDPSDYGGGAEGAAIAKCISRTERADSSITREQAGEMCTCITEKMSKAITNGGRGMSEATLTSCATKAGITLE